MVIDNTMNRWWVVLGSLMVQFCLGVIYAWSVFTPTLVDVGWTQTQTQIVFSTCLAVFAVVMVIAGRVLPTYGPRTLARTGGVLLSAGFFLAGLFGGTNFTAILWFIGILGGAGIGLAYVVPISVGMRWFPDKKGLITGLSVAGFGFGAMLWVKLAGSWGHLISSVGLSSTFCIYGAVFLVATLVGSVWLIYPKEDWVHAPKNPVPTPNPVRANQSSHEQPNLSSREMLQTSQFYMIFFAFAFSASAGLMCIGLMKLFPMKAMVINGVDQKMALAISGTAMAVFFSLANGLGRIAWGAISDVIGRHKSLALMTASQGVMVILFQWMAGNPALLYVAATAIGFNFGGNFALFPTLTADSFGTKHVGQNYGWVFLAYGVGGILGPVLGGWLGDLQNYPLAFSICGSLCLISTVMVLRMKQRQPAIRLAHEKTPGIDSSAVDMPTPEVSKKAS